MTIEETVSEIFTRFGQDIEIKFGTRELYFIAKECLWLYELCRGNIDGLKAPYFAPFKASFLYLLEKHRFEDAEQIYRSGLKDMAPIDFIKDSLANTGKTTDPSYRYRHDFLPYMDNLITFFSRLGYEKEILHEIINPLDNSDLPMILDMSEVKLLGKFLKCRDSIDCHDLLFVLFKHGNKLSSDIDNIKSHVGEINFRKWLLKRQMLGIYTAALAHCLNPGVFHNPGWSDLRKSFHDWVKDTYINYLTLIRRTVKGYVKNSWETIKTIKETGQWCEDIPQNLIGQVAKIAYRHSDVTELFKSFIGLSISFSWTDTFKTHLEKSKPSGNKPEEILSWLTEAVDFIEERESNFLTEQKSAENLARISKKIEERNEESFWHCCQNRFNQDRLKVLASSLANKYSSESAYFFTIPLPKLDKDKPIPTELCLLKKWGSTASIFERDKNHTANFGGGYFLYHNGFGLAIDPGPDFLKNLTQYTDFDLMDISGVVCTHTHFDHFADFNRIILGLREYNRQAGYKRLYYLLPDADDQAMHPEKLREDFCINVFEESVSKTQDPHRPECYYLPNTPWGKENGIKVVPIKVIHEIYQGISFESKEMGTLIEKWLKIGKSKNKKHLDKGKRWWSYALLLLPLRDGKPLTSILFSGDAEYRPDLFAGQVPELVILNCSSIRFRDITAFNSDGSEPFPGTVKKNHLGYSGLLGLLATMGGYRLALLGDFFEGQGEMDSRLLIASSLKADLHRINNKERRNILVAEPGMRIRFNQDKQLEVSCGPLCGHGTGFVALPRPEIDQIKRDRFFCKERITTCCPDCQEKKKILGLQKM